MGGVMCSLERGRTLAPAPLAARNTCFHRTRHPLEDADVLDVLQARFRAFLRASAHLLAAVEVQLDVRGDRRAKMKETSHQMHEPGDYNCRYNWESKEEGEEYGSYG